MKKILTIFIFLFISVPVFAQEISTSTQPLNQDDQALLNRALQILNSRENTINTTTGLPSGVSEQVTLKINPKIPEPGEQFNASLESYSTNLSKSNIVWRVNGEVIGQGIGQTQISYQTPEAGGRVTINVSIQKPNGGVITESKSFIPGEVDIIYESNTYTPPFYKGKAVFTREASIKFNAITNLFDSSGRSIPNDRLLFTWKLDHQVVADVSGVGKNIFDYQGRLLQRPMIVTVDVSSVDSDVVATKTITIQNTDPLVLIYENNPLLGLITERAVFGNFMLNREEISLKAVPYFFTAQTPSDGRLNYDWKLNGQKVNQTSNQDSVTFRNTDNSSGLSNINLSVSNFERILQSSRTKLSIETLENLANFEF